MIEDIRECCIANLTNLALFRFKSGADVWCIFDECEAMLDADHATTIMVNLTTTVVEIREAETEMVVKELPFRKYLVPKKLEEDWERDASNIPAVVDDYFPEALHLFESKWNGYLAKS